MSEPAAEDAVPEKEPEGEFVASDEQDVEKS